MTAEAAKEAGAVVTPSGLVYRSLKDGTGASPTATDTVKVHYRGTFPDGREFDSSYKRNEAIEFPLTGVIKCWTEGVQKMKVGGKAKLTCPPSIAYGERGAGSAVPPNATLHVRGRAAGHQGQISPIRPRVTTLAHIGTRKALLIRFSDSGLSHSPPHDLVDHPTLRIDQHRQGQPVRAEHVLQHKAVVNEVAERSLRSSARRPMPPRDGRRWKCRSP